MGVTELNGATRLAIASVIGFAIGLEREWSGHATGPNARFAGLRTFFLLGTLGGISGLLSSQGHAGLAIAMAAGGVVIAVAAYGAAATQATGNIDGTTEVAAIVVLGLGAVAGSGWLTVSSATGAVVLLALGEKQRLHDLVGAIGETELKAGLQFTVLAVVVLPLLPDGPYLGPLAIRPRSLWAVVLAFCALNFISYGARRAVGAKRGFGIAGALGGLLSSTAVTLSYARRSRAESDDASALAAGVIAACCVLIPRILIVSSVLNARVTLAVAPYLVPALVVGGLFIVLFHRRIDQHQSEAVVERSPLRLLNALQMAVAFQVALSIIAALGPRLSDLGLYGVSVALGLTDMDALTVSMSSPKSPIVPAVAARALAVGVLANTGFKLALATTVGMGRFKRQAGAGLATIAVAISLALLAL